MNTIEEIKRVTDTSVVVINQYGFITYVNERFSEVFGWTSDEILGRPVTTIIPTTLRDAHHMGFSRFITTGIPTLLNKPLNLKARLKDGREIESEHYVIAEKQNDQWVFGATIRPKTP